jgi:hypothetical protein
MEKKRTNSGPLRESTRKHSIYPLLSDQILSLLQHVDRNVCSDQTFDVIQAVKVTARSATYVED